MHVEHFMTKTPVTCDVNASLQDVGRQMRDKGVGCVVVLRNRRVAGIVTDRQLGLAFADGFDPREPITGVMTPDPATCDLDDNLFSVLDTMRSAGMVRRVPVINDANELVGLVSLSDIAVVARDLVDAVLLDEVHHSTREARLLTGAKRLVERIRRPTKTSRLLAPQPTRATRRPTRQGLPRASEFVVAEPRGGGIRRRGGRSGGPARGVREKQDESRRLGRRTRDAALRERRSA